MTLFEGWAVRTARIMPAQTWCISELATAAAVRAGAGVGRVRPGGQWDTSSNTSAQVEQRLFAGPNSNHHNTATFRCNADGINAGNV